MGLSVSSYVRLVLSNARGNAPNPINENDLSELRLSMKRIGNNLNQIARHANSRNFDDECAVALKARLSELSAATENVSNLIFEARRAR